MASEVGKSLPEAAFEQHRTELDHNVVAEAGSFQSNGDAFNSTFSTAETSSNNYATIQSNTQDTINTLEGNEFKISEFSSNQLASEKTTNVENPLPSIDTIITERRNHRVIVFEKKKYIVDLN